MQQKSYMNWQTALCLAAFITLIFVLPMFLPLYVKMMGRDIRFCSRCTQICICALQRRKFLYSSVFALCLRFPAVEGDIYDGKAKRIPYRWGAYDHTTIQFPSVASV